MAFDLPQKRIPSRQIQTIKQNIPVDQIIATGSYNPLGQGIETAGNLIGQALTKKAELQRQGQLLAQSQAREDQQLKEQRDFEREKIGMARGYDVQDLANKMLQNTTKIKALESQFGYKPGELGEEYPVAVMKVQSDLQAKRINSGPGATRSESMDKNRYRNYLLDMEQKDPVIKEINKQGLSLAAVDSLTNLVNEGNTVAFSALGLKMAKGMGEVGVMTEQDVKRYVNSGALSQKAADTLLTWVRGKPTEATMEDIGQITDVMKKSFLEKAQPRYDKYISAYANIEGLPPEEMAKKLSTPYGGGSLPKIDLPKPQAIKTKEQMIADELIRDYSSGGKR